jgi:hypothetical protein
LGSSHGPGINGHQLNFAKLHLSRFVADRQGKPPEFRSRAAYQEVKMIWPMVTLAALNVCLLAMIYCFAVLHRRYQSALDNLHQRIIDVDRLQRGLAGDDVLSSRFFSGAKPDPDDAK